MSPPVDRFAPSPTGRLHLGHAFSAILGHDAARTEGGRWLLRIEDLDQGRVRPDFEAAILDDLRWLGLNWDGPVLRQSERGAIHRAALERLSEKGLIYPCVCTRRDIAAAGAPQEGATSVPYPGTCRDAPPERIKGRPFALRLNLERTLALARPEGFEELDGDGLAGPGFVRFDAEAVVQGEGDPVLWRKDGAAAYHLAVVVDDAAQGVTTVTRGRDLLESTHLHTLLQALLGLRTPRYRHHRLIRDAEGKRLAKRDDARALAALRADGATPAEARALVGLPPQAVSRKSSRSLSAKSG